MLYNSAEVKIDERTSFGILIVIAVSVFNPKAVDLKLPENVNHITVLYGGETFELNEAKSKEVFSYFENLDIVTTAKTTQPAYTDGITVSFYNNETYLGEIYIYDMNTIIVMEENSLMKYLTDADLLEYFVELIESIE